MNAPRAKVLQYLRYFSAVVALSILAVLCVAIFSDRYVYSRNLDTLLLISDGHTAFIQLVRKETMWRISGWSRLKSYFKIWPVVDATMQNSALDVMVLTSSGVRDFHNHNMFFPGRLVPHDGRVYLHERLRVPAYLSASDRVTYRWDGVRFLKVPQWESREVYTHCLRPYEKQYEKEEWMYFAHFELLRRATAHQPVEIVLNDQLATISLRKYERGPKTQELEIHLTYPGANYETSFVIEERRSASVSEWNKFSDRGTRTDLHQRKTGDN